MKTNKDDNQTPTPYGIDKLSNIKPGVKIGFLKYWAAGATYFLVFVASGFQSNDGSTEMLVLFLLTTLMFEYIVNKFITWMDNDKAPTLQYLPFGYIDRKRILSLLSTTLYCLVMIALSFGFIWIIITVCEALHIPTLTELLIPDGKGSTDPFTFGFAWLFSDMLWMAVKRLIVLIKNSRKPEEEKEKKVYIEENEFPEPEAPKELSEDDKQKIEAYKKIIKDSRGNDKNEE